MTNNTMPSYSFSMEDLLNLPEIELGLDDFTVDDFTVATPSSDSNSSSQRSDAQHTAPSTPPTPATMGYACADNGCGCGATFRRPSQLKKHVEQRTRPHACTQDGCTVRPFSSKHDLNRHEREVHGCAPAGGRVVRLRCPYTNCKRHHRGFGRKENLALHMRTMHPESNPSASPSETTTDVPAPDTDPASSTLVHTPASMMPPTCTTPAVAAELELHAALQDRLAFLQTHRATLARQLQAMDEQIDAVQRTVSGLNELQGLDFGLDLGLGVGMGAGVPFP